jgi:hypothetical protein
MMEKGSMILGVLWHGDASTVYSKFETIRTYYIKAEYAPVLYQLDGLTPAMSPISSPNFFPPISTG